MKSFAEIREAYVTGKLFKVGDVVLTNEGATAEIVNLGPNYVTIVENGNISKKWITDIKLTKRTIEESNAGFSFKGYTTRNLNGEVLEMVNKLIESNDDNYAILNLIQTLDLIEGVNKKLVESNYDLYRISFDRAKKYLSKFNLTEHYSLSDLEDVLLEVSIEQDLKFTSADKSKVAYIIATSAGVDPTGSPVDVVNKAATHFKQSKLTPEGWKILGKMLNKATEAGINWNKNIFANSTKKYMELQ